MAHTEKLHDHLVQAVYEEAQLTVLLGHYKTD